MMQNNKSLLLILALFFSLHSIGYAAEFDNRDQFYKVQELMRLLQKAKDAGFSEDQIRRLTIQDGEEEINVLEYIAQVKNREAMKQKQIDDFRAKQFITPQDVFNELVTKESDQLAKLREELIRE